MDVVIVLSVRILVGLFNGFLSGVFVYYLGEVVIREVFLWVKVEGVDVLEVIMG